MAFAIVGAVVGAASAAYKIIDGAKQARDAKEEAKRAKDEYDRNKDMFAGLDTSNPYANMENTMEDLTVNQQAAEFMKQQQMQQRANIMDQMKGAAGGSGIAALAQAMANQGALDAQKASADIARQESANQQLQAQEASRLQSMERQGEVMSREMERAKVTGLLGMSQSEMQQAEAKRAAANEAIASGIGALGGVAMNYAGVRSERIQAKADLKKAGTAATEQQVRIAELAEKAGYGDDVEGYKADMGIID
tara:strand:+ start:8652 stop:9404 length:753 start_codon:yes stop_codon:yes gene_type:complete